MDPQRFNSQPPEGGWFAGYDKVGYHRSFQLTAARRRLVVDVGLDEKQIVVSTHSRPKAAGQFHHARIKLFGAFQLTAARRRLAGHDLLHVFDLSFQLTAARRRLDEMKS